MLVRKWKTYALRRAMRRVEKRRADIIRRGDPANNVLTLRLSDDAGDWTFGFKRLTARAAEGLGFNAGSSKGYAYSVLPRVFPDVRVRIEHYYKALTITYGSPTKFVILNTLRYHWFIWKFDRIAQALFNRRQLARKDRMTVLRVFADKALIKRSPKLSVSSIMNEIYGMRCVLHPHHEALRNHYQLILDSLSFTDDLQRDGITFQLTPKAFATLDQYEADRRRHEDILTAHWVLAILTFVLASTAVIELLR